MSASDLSGPPIPEALAALGTLREGVAAIRNLQHLLSSRDVGAQLLEQVVPDVASNLEAWPRITHDLVSLVQLRLKLEEHELEQFKKHASLSLYSVMDSLNIATQDQIRAKQRLTIERQLNLSLPGILSVLSSIELLVEATCNAGVPMSVSELLSSAPDKGSNRPHRSVTIEGPIETAMVSVSASMGLRCLGELAGLFENSTTDTAPNSVGICVESRASQVVFQFTTKKAGLPVVQLPIYPLNAFSKETVSAALRPYGGALLTHDLGIILPASD